MSSVELGSSFVFSLVKVGACQCLVCSIIAAAQRLYSTVNSSSVGMVGISCLCGLVLEEEHAGVSKFRAGLRMSARSAFICSFE